MKIKHKNLQQLYKDYIRENISQSRKSCLPLKKIINFYKLKLSEEQKTKIIDHITNCYSCAQEFEFILRTLRYERKLNEEIDKFLQSKENIAALRKAKRNISNARKMKKIFFPILSWKYGLLLIGAIIIISVLFIFLNPRKRKYRGIDLSQVHLIEPINGEYSRSLLVFKWNEFKDSDYYILELFDETLFQIWKSNKIFKNRTTLPIEIAKSLKENKVYFWMVTAFLSEGRKIESEIKEFKLAK